MTTATKSCLCSTNKDSSSKNGFQPAHSLTIWQRYGELKPYQEFEAFYGNRLSRVRAVSFPEVEGDRVRLLITPCKSRGTPKPISVRFAADAWVEVFNERTLPNGIDVKQLRNLVREVLTPTLQSKRQIADAVRRKTGQSFSPTLLDTVLGEIPEQFMRRRRFRAVNCYRLPIDFTPGMAVVENMSSPSQRYGWVEKLQFSRQHGTEFPVCRWLDGFQSFSSDDLLELVSDERMLNRIEQAKEIHLGRSPLGFIEIPYGLLRQFQRNTKDRELLLHLAKLLGLMRYDQDVLKGVNQTRKQIFEFLNIYYPEILETPHD